MERLEWQPNKEERQNAPNIKFICALGKYALRPWNTSLFTYRPEHGMNQYNHIFHFTKDEKGLYIPEHYIETKEYQTEYKKMEEYMLENNYPAHLNLTEVATSDIRIIHSLMVSELNHIDTVPEGWE